MDEQEEQINTLTESIAFWKREWRLMESANKKAEEEIAALIAENKNLGEYMDALTKHKVEAEDAQVKLITEYERLKGELQRINNLHNELLYAVERKFHGESRHETALRYIKDRESRFNEASSIVQDALKAESLGDEFQAVLNKVPYEEGGMK